MLVPYAASFGGGVSPSVFVVVLLVVIIGLPALLMLVFRKR